MTTLKLMGACLSLSILIAAASPYPAPAIGPKKSVQESESLEVRDKWAIMVGVNRFNDVLIPPQKLAQKSGADLARALKDADSGHFGLDHVLVVNGSGATKAGIEKAFEDWLFKKALPGDLVVIYFNSRLLADSQGKPLVCANDTKVSDAGNTGIKLLDLLKTARQRIGSCHILCMLDTSPALDNINKIDFDAKKLATESGVTVFSANELYKNSNEDTSVLETYFVRYFVEALKTGGGNYPLAMIAEYVWQKVQESTKALSGGAQAPIMALASQNDQTLSLPLGIVVKSSFPNKTVAIGHPLDTLAMERPDLVAPTLNPTKTTVKISSRSTGGQQSKPPAPPRVSAADMDEDDFDPNLDLRPYVSKVKSTIQKNWQVPKGFESRKVTTMFSIMRDGKITNAEVTESSGDEAVDKSALQALEAASPLDPLPKGAPRSVDLKYVFDWKTTVQNSAGKTAN